MSASNEPANAMDILIKLHNIHLLGEELGVLSCEFLVDLDSLEEARSRGIRQIELAIATWE